MESVVGKLFVFAMRTVTGTLNVVPEGSSSKPYMVTVASGSGAGSSSRALS